MAEVLAREEQPADATTGRALMEIVTTAASHMQVTFTERGEGEEWVLQTDKLDALVKNSLRDYIMVRERE